MPQGEHGIDCGRLLYRQLSNYFFAVPGSDIDQMLLRQHAGGRDGCHRGLQLVLPATDDVPCPAIIAWKPSFATFAGSRIDTMLRGQTRVENRSGYRETIRAAPEAAPLADKRVEPPVMRQYSSLSSGCGDEQNLRHPLTVAATLS
jgi:hypothetical protein